MKTFTDSTGKTWTLSLTIDAAKRVKGLLGVNLLDLTAGEPPLLTRLGTDVILLCDVLYCMVKPQADTAGVTDEQFGSALGGEAILAAQTAFYEELVDFFRKAGRGEVARAVETQRRLIDLTVQRIETRIEQMDIETMLDAALGRPSTNWPASPESTPDP